jgi:glycogen debranching enzyme
VLASKPRSPEGIFHQDTRYLSHLHLTIEGERPMLLSSTVRDNSATMTCGLGENEHAADLDSRADAMRERFVRSIAWQSYRIVQRKFCAVGQRANIRQL